MFGLSFSELLIIVTVAVLVIGPNDLPRVVRSVSRFMRGLSALTQEVKRQMNEAIGDEELVELRHLRESLQGQRRFLIDEQGNYQETYDISDLMKDREAPAVTPADADALPEAAPERDHAKT